MANMFPSQPHQTFTSPHAAEELMGILEIPDRPELTGGYADIYHGFWTNSQGERVEVAIKILKALTPRSRTCEQDSLIKKAEKRIKREVFFWSQMKHPNLHPLLGYRSRPQPQLVSPWCYHGDLGDYLRSNPSLSQFEKLLLVYQAGCGLLHLHSCSPPICHADIKPGNVLINDLGEAALSDFGLSRVISDLDVSSGFTTSETVKGTFAYMAGELSSGQKPSCESDVYAFGGLILTVMSNQAPFYGLSQLFTLRRIMQNEPPKPEDHLALPAHDPLWGLMRRCWDPRPAARPTIDEVLIQLWVNMSCEQPNPRSSSDLAPAIAHDGSDYSKMDFDIPSEFSATSYQPLHPGNSFERDYSTSAPAPTKAPASFQEFTGSTHQRNTNQAASESSPIAIRRRLYNAPAPDTNASPQPAPQRHRGPTKARPSSWVGNVAQWLGVHQGPTTMSMSQVQDAPSSSTTSYPAFYGGNASHQALQLNPNGNSFEPDYSTSAPEPTEFPAGSFQGFTGITQQSSTNQAAGETSPIAIRRRSSNAAAPDTNANPQPATQRPRGPAKARPNSFIENVGQWFTGHFHVAGSLDEPGPSDSVNTIAQDAHATHNTNYGRNALGGRAQPIVMANSFERDYSTSAPAPTKAPASFQELTGSTHQSNTNQAASESSPIAIRQRSYNASAPDVDSNPQPATQRPRGPAKPRPNSWVENVGMWLTEHLPVVHDEPGPSASVNAIAQDAHATHNTNYGRNALGGRAQPIVMANSFERDYSTSAPESTEAPVSFQEFAGITHQSNINQAASESSPIAIRRRLYNAPAPDTNANLQPAPQRPLEPASWFENVGQWLAAEHTPVAGDQYKPGPSAQGNALSQDAHATHNTNYRRGALGGRAQPIVRDRASRRWPY